MMMILKCLVFFFFVLLLTKSTSSINGGTMIALAGKDGIIVATDSRFSSHQLNAFMLSKSPRKIFRVGSRALCGGIGLEADGFHLMEILKASLTDYVDCELEPETISNLVANILFTRSLYLTPLVAGISSKGKPCIYSFDGLGAKTKSSDFAVVGTSNSALFSLLESMYQSNLTCEKLCELTEQCLSLAFERDILSGSDINIVTLRKDGIFMKQIKRTDV